MADANEIDAAFVPARADTVYSVAIDGEAVLLDESVNRLHHLNHTAALLWTCFDGEASIATIVGEISDELGLEEQQVLESSIDVVRHLGAEGLLAGVPRAVADDDEAP
jgi:hypothetical protein